MAPELTEGSDSTDQSQALDQELIDHSTAIIHEGVSRNFQDIFLSEAADIPPATERWQLPLNVQDGTPTHPEHFEQSLLGGMLLWLSTPGSDPYTTSSSLAARNAAYLKAIRYPIGPICVRDGQHFPARYVCIVECSILDRYEVRCSHVDPVRKAQFLYSPLKSRCSQQAKQ